MVGASGAFLLQQRAWSCLRDPRQHRDFRHDRIRRPLLESDPRRRNQLADLLFHASAFQRDRGLLGRASCLNAIPILNIGNLLMTIDPLSIFFWTAAMFTFWLALERSPNFSWFWPVTGLLVGIGFLCKYTNAFELVSIVLVLALVPRLRREFKRPGFLLSPRRLRTLHAAADHLESEHDLDHADASSFAGKPGSLHRRSSARVARVSRRPFLLFLAAALFWDCVWATIANWRRAHQQFKVLYLFGSGCRFSRFIFSMSINKQAAPNWDVARVR